MVSQVTDITVLQENGTNFGSAGIETTRVDTVKWYPLKPADFTGKKTESPKRYEAPWDQTFSKHAEYEGRELHVFEHICLSNDTLRLPESLRKSADELRWEHYQGKSLGPLRSI